MVRINMSRIVSDPLRRATEDALRDVLDPLLNLMVDTGITVPDLTRIIRERAVRNATARFVKETGRASKSRVSIVTGLPRSVVARFIKSSDASTPNLRGQHPARKVLEAWHRSPRFLAPDGGPAILPIFGTRVSFEKLVQRYSGGVPVRAMLDELCRIGALEFLSEQRVRVKSREPTLIGLNKRAIGSIGERARDLLETLTKNLLNVGSPLFEATAVIPDADSSMLSSIRREVSQQGSSFIGNIDTLLTEARKVASDIQSDAGELPRRVGVTVYYFQEEAGVSYQTGARGKAIRRTNLRRGVKKRATRGRGKMNSSGTSQ